MCKYGIMNLYILDWKVKMRFQHKVDFNNNGKAIKSILKNEFNFSKGLIKKLKNHGKIFCNQAPVFVNHIVQTGDIVEAVINFEERSENVKPVKMDLRIIYEDDSIIALDKPPDTVIHPVANYTENTIANGLMYYFKSRGLHIKIRPVSRLDRETTGVIVFAKNQFIQQQLIDQMKAKKYHKEYTGIVHGCPAEASGTINLPIARVPDTMMLREISPEGAPSVTHYKVVERLNEAAVLHFVLETGRTHQIRVHCQAIGHPLIGDTLYSDISTGLIGRQALHSHYTSFVHPVTNKLVEISAPLPQDMVNLIWKFSI